MEDTPFWKIADDIMQTYLEEDESVEENEDGKEKEDTEDSRPMDDSEDDSGSK